MSDTPSSLNSMSAARQQSASFTTSIKETQEAGIETEQAISEASQEVSEEKLQTEAQENSVMGMAIRSQKLQRKEEFKTEKAKQAQQSVLVRKEDADELADQFSGRQGNREYHLDPLLLSQLAQDLGSEITENTAPEEIINIIRKRMSVNGQDPDVSIVDKTFEFLLELTRTKLNLAVGNDKTRLTTLYQKIEVAKDQHFNSNSIAIQVAQKIIGAVDSVATMTGMTIKETLDRYREVVHNPPDLQTLRKYYESKGYKAMILELKGLNSYLGGNLKRTNLENPELAQLANAARKMQALLGVFRQAKIHQSTTMESYLELQGVLAA